MFDFIAKICSFFNLLNFNFVVRHEESCSLPLAVVNLAVREKRLAREILYKNCTECNVVALIIM